MSTNTFAWSIEAISLCDFTENCLSWLIILLDILAIFYLIFVSLYKKTQFIRVLGGIWLGILIAVNVTILAIHLCIFTILCVALTLLIIIAMLAVILSRDKDVEGKKPDGEAKCGSYIVREIDSKRFCFELYDDEDKFLVRSFNYYDSSAEAKSAISLCRESGLVAGIEDRTVKWITEIDQPKFAMAKDGMAFYFKLSSSDDSIIVESDRFSSLKTCRSRLKKMVSAVASTAVYVSEEKLSEASFEYYSSKIAKEEKKEEVAVAAAEESAEPAVADAPAVLHEAEPAAEGGIYINNADKKSIAESYAELSKEQKAFFDGLRKAAREKEGAREAEYTSQLTFSMFKSKLLSMRIRRGVVEAIFMLMDDAFKRMDGAGDLKIKESKTIIKIEDETYYALAIETLNTKYDLLIEQKREKEERKKAERRERLRQKRLAAKNASAAEAPAESVAE